jgi:hypothetical protein
VGDRSSITENKVNQDSLYRSIASVTEEEYQRGQGAITSPIDTNIPPIFDKERLTPRAQTRQEAEQESLKRRSRASSTLEGE